MFSNHRLFKAKKVCFVAAGFLIASLTTVQAQSSRAKSAASYYARGSEWHAHRGMLWSRLGRKAEADADFAQCLALKPHMKSSLEQRLKQLQARHTRSE